MEWGVSGRPGTGLPVVLVGGRVNIAFLRASLKAVHKAAFVDVVPLACESMTVADFLKAMYGLQSAKQTGARAHHLCWFHQALWAIGEHVELFIRRLAEPTPPRSLGKHETPPRTNTNNRRHIAIHTFQNLAETKSNHTIIDSIW